MITRSSIVIPAVALALLAALPSLLLAEERAGGASVALEEPARFTDLTPPHLVEDLGSFIERSAGRHVAEGQTLHIIVTDVDMAGGFQPGDPQREHIRLMAPTFPPRIDLRFSLIGADGTVIEEGERTLRDLSYLMRPRPKSDPDPLVYEKQMINEWLLSEFGE